MNITQRVFLVVLSSSLFIAHSLSNNVQLFEKPQNLLNQDDDSKWPIDPIYFNCLGKEEGYYADHYRGCKVFYYCKPDGTIMSFICPEDYIFDDDAKTCGPPDKVVCPPYDPSKP